MPDLHCPWCRILLAPPLNSWEPDKPKKCGLCEKPFVVLDGAPEKVEEVA